mmetsp:Transcript_24455/g.39387  ORF Transcript_24455/g.39387 Transcript_24455/m.39387 type:complete len:282 (+) Transcript_24455:97-942(+)
MLDFFAEGEMQVAFDTEYGEDEDREVTMFGVTFKVKQERGSMPVSQGSMVVGNTLWNSSIILTKYLEDGAEGTAHEFSAAACKGKRAIELGAGCAGLVGLSLACLGCSHVTITDKAEVLPLLRENVRRFIEAAQALPTNTLPTHCAAILGNIYVEELDWLDSSQIRAQAGNQGFDLVVGADISYATSFHASLLDTTCAVAAPHAYILMAEDLRSPPAHRAFRSMFGLMGFFSVQIIGAPKKLSQCNVLSLHWQSQAEAIALRQNMAKGGKLHQLSSSVSDA